MDFTHGKSVLFTTENLVHELKNNIHVGIDIYNGATTDENIQILSKYLKNNDAMELISFKCCEISDVAVNRLLGALCTSKSIKKLCFSHCNLSNIGIQLILHMPVTKTTLIELVLDGNYINSHTSHKLSKIIKFNKTLRVLSLESCFSDCPENIMPVIESLGTNTSITKLNLNRNNLNHEMPSIIRNLSQNQSLKYLFLSHNNISENGIQSIIYFLSETTIKSINLSGNRIIKNYTKEIASVLQQSRTLDEIILRDCRIDNNSICVLIESLKNSLIERVDFYGNYINHESLKKIIENLQENYIIKYFCISLDKKIQKSISKIIQRNHEIAKKNIKIAHRNNKFVKLHNDVMIDMVIDKKNECCVCFEEIIEKYAIINCGHTNVCRDCINSLTWCPNCCYPFTQFMKIYDF